MKVSHRPTPNRRRSERKKKSKSMAVMGGREGEKPLRKADIRSHVDIPGFSGREDAFRGKEEILEKKKVRGRSPGDGVEA